MANMKNKIKPNISQKINISLTHYYFSNPMFSHLRLTTQNHHGYRSARDRAHYNISQIILNWERRNIEETYPP